MKQAARILLLAMLLVALPLRGYAGVLMAFCESQHGGTSAVEGLAHEHGDGHHGEGRHHDAGTDASGTTGGPSHAASVCSVCASCCASADLSSIGTSGVEFQFPDSNPIPFFGRQVSGFIPDHLDRPPLPL